jgi:hypothetical protein
VLSDKASDKRGTDAFEIDLMFTQGQRVGQIFLVDSAKRAQKIADGGPQAFDGVGVDPPASIAVVIPRPFLLPMTHGVMGALDPVVSLPFICLRLRSQGKLL